MNEAVLPSMLLQMLQNYFITAEGDSQPASQPANQSVSQPASRGPDTTEALFQWFRLQGFCLDTDLPPACGCLDKQFGSSWFLDVFWLSLEPAVVTCVHTCDSSRGPVTDEVFKWTDALMKASAAPQLCRLILANIQILSFLDWRLWISMIRIY